MRAATWRRSVVPHFYRRSATQISDDADIADD